MNPPTASERAQTMLAVLPWLGAREGATVAEICERFGTDPATLIADLESVFVNVEPEVGPDHMIEVDVEGDWVSVKLADYFRRPPRLDHNQALLLLAAGTSMQHETGIGEVLRSAVAKLARSLGPGAIDALEVDLGPASPPVLAALREALAERRSVQMSYFTWGRDELGTRTVDPHALRSIDGQWYLSGWCHDRRAIRHFRVDRIHSVEVVGPEHAFDVPDELEDPVIPSGEGILVELLLPIGEAAALSSYPLESSEEKGDQMVVRLRIHADAWLDRLLLRLGPRVQARVVETGESLAPRRAAAARSILERHGVFGPGEGSPVRSTR